jgi:hypothetical protein
VIFQLRPLLLVRLYLADREWIWRGMIGDWQDEWDLKRRGSNRSVNRHDTCRGAAFLNLALNRTSAPLPRGVQPFKAALAENEKIEKR